MTHLPAFSALGLDFLRIRCLHSDLWQASPILSARVSLPQLPIDKTATMVAETLLTLIPTRRNGLPRSPFYTIPLRPLLCEREPETAMTELPPRFHPLWRIRKVPLPK